MSANFWKFYCWIYAAISVPTALVEIANIAKWRLVDFLILPNIVFGFLVIYSYAYKVKVFSRNIWRIAWWYSIGWTIITIFFSSPPFDKYYPDFLKSYYNFEPKPAYDDQFYLLIGLLCFAVMLPLYYANYVLAFDKKYLNSSKDKKDN